MASHYQGVDGDLRNLYRRGSGLTPRRLWVPLRGLPTDAPVWLDVRAAEEAAAKSEPDEIRDRQAAFEARNQRAREAASSG